VPDGGGRLQELGERHAPGEFPRLVDSFADDRVLLIGRLPPQGRDLDLVARPPEEAALTARLSGEGFRRHGTEWVRFRRCSAEVVEIIPSASWHLPSSELKALFSEARPIDGMGKLVRPAPHHLLLILARGLVRRGGELQPKHRARIDAALAEDSAAWSRASDRAGQWRARAALRRLESAHRTGASLSRAERAAALAEWGEALGPWRARRARLRAWKAIVVGSLEGRFPRRRRRCLVTVSGLDGAGKTSQTEALRTALRGLRVESARAWVRMEWTTLNEGGSTLDRVARPVKRTMRALSSRPRSAPPVATGPPPAPGPAHPPDPVREARARSTLLTHAWVVIVALAHAAAQRRVVRAHRGCPVVICDRYTLDAVVQLRYRYGERHRFRRQAWLIRLLSPKPTLSYYIDVPGATAYVRQPEQYDRGELERQARLYREEYDSLGGRRLDGERPREELCRAIALDVWGRVG
jgi:thymidylate kinase